jgi:alpha/beta superfamily hydrolase
MFDSSLIFLPGIHEFNIEFSSHRLEARLVVPEQYKANKLAVLGHPHSLQGGTMNNKVVTTLARAFREAGVVSLSMNFRGVGNSEGQYDDGIGESDDMIQVTKFILNAYPEMKFILAGFSFGSYVTYRAAAQIHPNALISIAPAVNHYQYDEYPIDSPWLVVMGDEDEVVEPKLVSDFFAEKPVTYINFSQTTHFFHGKLIELKDKILPFIQQHLD